MEEDQESKRHWPNQTSREVHSGHYVRVKTQPLEMPELVLFSDEMAAALNIDRSIVNDPKFIQFVSADVHGACKDLLENDSNLGAAWATPYALAIYGTPYTDNCPFKTGKGYGDGRAASIFQSKYGWELQLKGSGPTPFCRGADGRAVLRSSVREFIASEAMNNMKVSTTRALSLVVSKKLKIMRPWYSSSHAQDIKDVEIPDFNDPRLRGYPLHVRQQLIDQLKYKMRQPNGMLPHKAAITCRTAPSFIRVGHFDLFARRVAKIDNYHDDGIVAKKQLNQLFLHTMKREFPLALSKFTSTTTTESNNNNDNSKHAYNNGITAINNFNLIAEFLELTSSKIAKLTADWIRVGYCQGNFNSDNCLVAGRTMDYGPFGYVQKFEPYWNMWLGGGQHFGFLNQPLAGEKNFLVLANSVIELLDRKADKELMKTKFDSKHFKKIANAEMGEVWRKKLGLLKFDDTVSKLIKTILEVMEECEMDYTMFWWQLSMCTKFLNKFEDNNDSVNEEVLLEPLLPCFYNVNALNDIKRGHICKCIKDWLTIASNQNIKSSKEMNQLMRNNSPKYIPREWMFVNAYTEANEGSYTLVQELYELFKNPYRLTEYDGSNDQYFNKYYRKAPKCTYEGIGIGGEAYMT